MRVGFLGLGIMGSRMAANLRSAGFELAVWNRTAETASLWAEQHGATLGESPADVASCSDVVISMVVDGPQVESVLLGENGVAEGAHRDLLCVDMSTIGPQWARAIARGLSDHGIKFVDAPVTGSAPRAQDGSLAIMVGGDPDQFERAKPLFDAMGQVVEHVGAIGDGQAIKLINNTLAAANASALAEALVLAQKSNLDLDAMMKIVEAGSGASAMATLKARAMRDRNFSPLFKTDHMLKDVRLCLEEARLAGVRFSSGQHAESLLDAASSAGHGDEDFASIIEPVEHLESDQQ